MAGPIVDGLANAKASGTGNAIVTALTTSTTDQVVCAVIYNESGDSSTPATSVASITGGSLTFTKRKRYTSTIGNGSIELWYARAPAILNNVSFTTTLAGAYDDASSIFFSLRNVNSLNPFDPNASVPQGMNVAAGTPPGFSGIYTTNTNSMLLFIMGSADNWTGTNFNQPSQFSAYFSGNNGGTLYSQLGMAWYSTGTKQVNTAYNWNEAIPSGTGGTVAMFDVFTSDGSGSPTPTPTPTPTRRPVCFVST